MEVFVDAETENEAQEIFNDIENFDEYENEFVEQVSIELSEENTIQVGEREETFEIPAKNLGKYNFSEFSIRFKGETIFKTDKYEDALDKYEEVRRHYTNSHRSSLNGRNEEGLFTIHYIHDNKIKDYSFLKSK